MSALIVALGAALYAAMVVALCRAAARADRSMGRIARENLD